MSQGEGQSGVILPLAKQNCLFLSCAYRRARVPENCDHYSITKVSHSNLASSHPVTCNYSSFVETGRHSSH